MANGVLINNAKIRKETLTRTTGTGGGIGNILIPKSEYPEARFVIPFGVDGFWTVGYGGEITDYYIINVYNIISGAWADGQTVTFQLVIVY